MKIIDNIKKGKFLPVDKPDNKFWYDPDDKIKYNENLKTQPQDWHYRKKIITYDVNSDGYRTKEFDLVNWAKTIVIFGGSNVYGVGCAEDETVPFLLEKITGIPVINLGVSGSSSTFALHNSGIFSNYYPTPKAVIHSWTSPFRCPYYMNNEVIHCGHWHDDPKGMAEKWNSTLSHPNTNILLNSIISKQMWIDKCSYYEYTLFESTSQILNCDFIQKEDDARDIEHPGRLTNNKTAEQIAKNIKL
jgi:hypothetical protein